MLIPNYDNLIDKKKKNFKQLYNYMPSKCFRMLICGPSGSEKTNALVHMLLKLLIYYGKIYFYAKNIAQEKYQLLNNELINYQLKINSQLMKYMNILIAGLKILMN